MSKYFRQHFMENNVIKEFLQKLDLSEKEIKVYLYCLSHGPQLMSRLAQISNTTRTNSYDIVKKLEQKGLCNTVGSSYGRKVKACSPENISGLLENKEKQIKELKKDLVEVLPILKHQSNGLLSPFTRVSYFEGIDSVRKMLWQSLQAKNKIIKIAGSELDMVSSLGKEYVADFHIKRKAKEIHLKSLRPDSNRVIGEIFLDDKKYLREIRIRPKGKVRLKSNLIIWDNYIAIYSLKDKIIFGTLIESEEMTIMFDSWFDFIWNNSKGIS